MDYGKFYQEELYPLQDKALHITGRIAPDFYLTGGTALSRFYLHHRYSEDIDLFVNRHKDFSGLTDKIFHEFRQQFVKCRIQLSDTDFLRLFVADDDEVELKIEMINDVGYHYHPGQYKTGWMLDSWQNILSNKITALSRNAAKDFADVLFLCLKYSFNWIDIFDAAKLKDTWVNEITIATILDSFKAQELSDIKWIDYQMDVRRYDSNFHIIAKDILMGADNSLYRKEG